VQCLSDSLYVPLRLSSAARESLGAASPHQKRTDGAAGNRINYIATETDPPRSLSIKTCRKILSALRSGLFYGREVADGAQKSKTTRGIADTCRRNRQHGLSSDIDRRMGNDPLDGGSIKVGVRGAIEGACAWCMRSIMPDLMWA